MKYLDKDKAARIIYHLHYGCASRSPKLINFIAFKILNFTRALHRVKFQKFIEPYVAKL